MKRLFGFVILFVTSYAWGSGNVVVNPGFDMTPWDTGWTTHASMVSHGGGISPDVTYCHSRPVSCRLNAYGHGHSGDYMILVTCSQEVEQVTSCTCHVHFRNDPSYVVGILRSTASIALMINGRWSTQWATHGNNLIWTKWTGIYGASDTVSGIRFAAEGASTRYGSPFMCFWIDDVDIRGRKVITKEKPICTICPNPFRSQTVIRYWPYEDYVSDMTICDMAGRTVRRLKRADDQAVWDGRDANGRQVAPGVYFVRLERLHKLSVGVTEKVIRL